MKNRFDQVPLDLTNGNPYKKRFVDRPMKSQGSKIDSGSGKRNLIGAACSEGSRACTRDFSRRFATRYSVALREKKPLVSMVKELQLQPKNKIEFQIITAYFVLQTRPLACPSCSFSV